MLWPAPQPLNAFGWDIAAFFALLTITTIAPLAAGLNHWFEHHKRAAGIAVVIGLPFFTFFGDFIGQWHALVCCGRHRRKVVRSSLLWATPQKSGTL